MAIRVRRRRRPTSRTRFRIKKHEWRDPFPGIPGTEPEKRIFAALVYKRIFFIFQGNLSDMGGAASSSGRDWKPDFIIPEYRVIIDPYSEYHHSKAPQALRDAEKATAFQKWGWSYYHPWSGQITKDGGVAQFLASIPEFRGPKVARIPAKYASQARFPGYVLGPNLGLGASSVGAANRKRRRFSISTLARGTRRRRY